MQRILERMLRQCPPPETLQQLCEYAGGSGGGCETAFFLPTDSGWTLAAKGDLNQHAEWALARMDPARISDALFRAPEYRFEGGRARHLHSGAGELLGLVAVFREEPVIPDSIDAIRMDSICSLAALAIEQANLMGELACHTELARASRAPDCQSESEIPVQEVTRMIAQQCPPKEILAVLCSYTGRAEAERQVAFFLTRGLQWELAAKGELTPQSEAALARLDPESLSDKIFEADSHPEANANAAVEWPFEDGWARHLCSGTGELLGLIVGFTGSGGRLQSAHAARIESACRLAVLAIEQTNLIEELAFKADHDPLTGLPNRGYYDRALHSELRESGRTGSSVALLYINLDRFRLVNDVMGLATGNRLLEHVGGRLRQHLRAGSMLARMGGDEFAVLVPGITAAGDAAAIAARLLDSLSAPFSIDGHELYITASIGISCSNPVFSSGESTPESLEREAYLALYEAKRAGKARAVRFDSSMAAISPERLEMEKRLRFALARGEFAVYYQPQIRFSTNRVSGVEALLRWRPEGLGLVSPATFIPLLEEMGLIVDVGQWVLRESCRQGREWLDNDGLRLRIGVNVSGAQLLYPDFIGQVAEALTESRLPPELLELELTESVFVGEFSAASRVLTNLQALGIQVALDDFGTGQSSLSYLHRLPFQRLKIDQSFIRGIAEGEECPPVVRNIVQMAGSLGMEAIAEGVETAHQAELLRREGCEEAQGFLYSRARPAGAAADFCRCHHHTGGKIADTQA